MKKIWYLAHPYDDTTRMIVFAALDEEYHMLTDTIEPHLYCEAISDSFTDSVHYAGKCGFDMSLPSHVLLKDTTAYVEVKRRLSMLRM